MTRMTLASAALYALVSTPLSAQTPAPSPAPQFPPAQPATATAAMTLTGCLKPWDTATMGPLAAPRAGEGTPAPAAGAVFALTGAEAAAKTPTLTFPGMPAPAAPGAGAANPGATPATYRLQAQSGGVDLARHANEKVEVMGAVVMDASMWFRGAGTPGATPAGLPPPTTPAGGTPSTGASGTPTQSAAGTPTAAAGTAPATFLVTSIKTIAKTCS